MGYSLWGRKESDTTEQYHFLLLSIRTEKQKLYSNALLQKIVLSAGVCVCVCIISWEGSPGRESVFSWVCISAGDMGMLLINYVLTIQGDSQARGTKRRQ